MGKLKSRVVRTVAVASLALAAFFAALFGFLSADRTAANAAGAIDHIKVTVNAGQSVHEADSYESMGGKITVTAYSDQEESEPGTVLTYGEAENGYTITSGSFSIASPTSYSQENTFVFSFGDNQTQEVPITVERNNFVSLEATFTGSSALLYSYSSLTANMFTVTGTKKDGSQSILPANGGLYTIVGNLMPEEIVGAGETFSKEVKIVSIETDQYTDYNGAEISTTCKVDGISPVEPFAVSVSYATNNVIAYDAYDPQLLTVTVSYFVGGRLYSGETTCYDITYGDSNGTPIEEAEGFPYLDDGLATLVVTYQEYGKEMQGASDPLTVNKRPAQLVGFDGGYSYAYQVIEGEAVSIPCDPPVANNFNTDRMRLTKVTYLAPDSQQEVVYYEAVQKEDGWSETTNLTDKITVELDLGSFSVSEVGEYHVSYTLIDPAYYWIDDESTSRLDYTTTFTISPAPLRDFKITLTGEESGTGVSGDPYKWDYDGTNEGIEIGVSGNYGKGSVTYTYYNESGSPIGSNTPIAAGSYSVEASVPESGNFLGGTTVRVYFMIGMRTLAVPQSIGTKVYNGANQTADLTTVSGGEADVSAYEKYCTIENKGGVEVGEYTVTYTINETDNARWADYEDNPSAVRTITFNITPLKIAKPTFGADGTVVSTFTNANQTQSFGNFNRIGSGQEVAGSEFLVDGSFRGAVEIAVAADSEKGNYAFSNDDGSVTVFHAGTYTITLSLSDTKNLVWEDTGASYEYTWEVQRKGVSLKQIENGKYDPDVKASATVSLNDANATFEITPTDAAGEFAVSGTTISAHDAGEYSFTVMLTNDDYCWNADGSDESKTSATWTVDQKEISVPSVRGTYVYTGSDHTVKFDGTTGDNAYSVGGAQKGTNAGTYEVTFTLNPNNKDTTNYIWKIGESTSSEKQTVSWSIGRQGVAYPVLTGEYTYNAQAQTVRLAEGNLLGTAYNFAEGSGTATDAGTYSVTFELTENYCWLTDTTGSTGSYKIENGWVIARYSIAFPTLSYSGGAGAGNTYHYGDPITATPVPTTPGLDGADGFTVKEGSQTSATDAGLYTVTFVLDKNYQWDEAVQESYVYDYQLQWNVNPLAIVAPTYADDGETSFGYGADAYDVQFGKWTEGENGIAPIQWSVEWNAGDADAIFHSYKTNNSGLLQIRDAGTYQVSFKLSNDNFEWDGSAPGTFTFTVSPMVLEVTEWDGAAGLKFNNAARKPVVKTSNVLSDDQEAVGFTYRYTQDGSVVEPTDAGTYLVTVNGLTGAAAHNYTLDVPEGQGAQISCGFEIEKYVIKTGDAVSFIDSSKPDGKQNTRYIEFISGTPQTPTITLKQPLNMTGVITYSIEKEESIAYGTYWIRVEIASSHFRNFQWEITEVINESDNKTVDEFLADSNERIVRMWYQITKTRLDDIGLHFDGNITEWYYGEEMPDIIHTAGSIEGIGNFTYYFFGTPRDETYNGQWQAFNREQATEDIPKYAGEYTLLVVLSESDNYEQQTFLLEFIINPAPLSLTFDGVQSDGSYLRVYGDDTGARASEIQLKAPGGEGEFDAWSVLGIEYTYSETGTTVPRAVGEYTVTVTINNANYVLGETKTSFKVEKKEITVTVDDETITYGDGAPSYTLIYSDGSDDWPWEYKDDADVVTTNGKFIYNDGAAAYEAGSPAGSYTVKADGLTAANYTFVYENGTLTVDQRKVTVDFGSLDTTYSGNPVVISPKFVWADDVHSGDALYSDDVIALNYAYTWKGAPYGGSGNDVAVNAGAWTVTVTLSGSEDMKNYSFDGEQTKGFDIAQAPLTIRFEKDTYSVDYGTTISPDGSEAGYALTIEGWVNGEGDTIALSPTFRTLNATRQEDYQPGNDFGAVRDSYTVTVLSLGEESLLSNYQFSYEELSAVLQVTQREVEFGVISLEGVTGNSAEYRASAYTVAVKYTAFGSDQLALTYSYSHNEGGAEGSGAAYAVDAGSWLVTIGLNNSDPVTKNYKITDAPSYPFAITQAKLSISVTDPVGSTFYYGDTLDAMSRFKTEISGYKGSDNGLLTLKSYTVVMGETPYTPGSPAGKYTVTPVFNTDALENYMWDPVSLTFTVERRPVTIRVPDMSSVYGSEPDFYQGVEAEQTDGVGGLVPGHNVSDIVELLAKDGDAAIGTQTPAKAYALKAGTILNDNYDITFIFTDSGEQASVYTITAAVIELTEKVADHVYSGTYDSNEHPVLDGIGFVNTVNNQRYTWHFKVDDGVWVEVSDFAGIVKLEQAGKYTVSYYITAPNHKEYGSEGTPYTFEVSIRQYSVTIRANGTVTYGEDEYSSFTPQFYYDGGWKDALPFGDDLKTEGIMTAEGEYIFTVSDDYGPGDPVDRAYTITLSDADSVTKVTNYTLSYETGTLTVQARKIVVEIGDSGSTYGNEFTTPTAALAEGSSAYTPDLDDKSGLSKIVALAVLGPKWDAPEVSYNYTENPADQPKAPVLTDGCYYIVGSSINGNYEIEFRGSETYQGQGAGRYVVKARGVSLRVQAKDLSPDYLIYNGERKEFVASVLSEDEDPPVDEETIDFRYLYESTDGKGYSSGQAPIEAGAYQVKVSANNQNYTIATAATPFTIAQATYTDKNTLSVQSLFGEASDSFIVGDEPLFGYIYTYNGEACRPAAIDSYLEGLAQGGATDNSYPRIDTITEGKTDSAGGDGKVTIGSVEYDYKLITVTFEAGSGNYQAPDAMRFIVVVQPLTVDVVWGDAGSNAVFTYNGANQSGSVNPYYRDIEGEQVLLDKSLAEGSAFVNVGEYRFTASFREDDNLQGNYALRESEDASSEGLPAYGNGKEQVYRILPLDVLITVGGDGKNDTMQYGDAIAERTKRGEWWNFAAEGNADNIADLFTQDKIVITVTAYESLGGNPVTPQTRVGANYYLVAQESAADDALPGALANYNFLYSGSVEERYGSFAVTPRVISVTIDSVGSAFYGETMQKLTAQLAEGSALSAASGDAGPNGETLEDLIRLSIEGQTDGVITSKTPADTYTIVGEDLSENYAISFTEGEYVVQKASFEEEDFSFKGYSGTFDNSEHDGLAVELVNQETAAYQNRDLLNIAYFIVNEEGDDIPLNEFIVEHASQSGEYKFYAVVTDRTTGKECYERTNFTFTVTIETAENKLTFSWNGLEYGVDGNGTRQDAKATYGAAKLDGIYAGTAGDADTTEPVIDGSAYETAEDAYAQFILLLAGRSASTPAGDYYAKFTVEGFTAEEGSGLYDYETQTFRVAFSVAQYRVTLVWTADGETEDDATIQFTDSDHVLALKNARTAQSWMDTFSLTVFNSPSSSGGVSGTDPLTGYPTITASAVGSYTITLTLADPDNYIWAAENNNGEFVFTIAAEENEILDITVNDEGWIYGVTDGMQLDEIIGLSGKFISFRVKISDGATYAYRFALADGDEYTNALPTDAGEYKVIITVTVANYGTATSGPVLFEISPKPIEAPAFENAATTYNGREQTNRIVSSDEVRNVTWITSENFALVPDADGFYVVQTDAGTYHGTVELRDPNYIWSDRTTDPKTISWTIRQATPELTGELALENDSWTYGDDMHALPGGVTVSNIEGAEVLYVYFSETYEQLVQEPTDAGTYYIAAYVAATDNYTESWLTADGDRVYVPFTIGKASYGELAFDLNGWQLQEDGSYGFVYDGDAHGPEIASLPTGLDGIALQVRYEGAATDVADGVVTRTAVFTTESKNYNLPASLTVKIQILPYETEVVWEQTEFGYTGQAQTVTAYYLDVDGERRTVKVTIGEDRIFCDAADNYTATAVGSDTNYSLTNTQTTLVIAPLAVTVTIGNAEATYGDADAGSPVLSAEPSQALPDAAEDVYRLYVDGLGEKVNAGTYAIKGEASGDRTANYALTFVEGVYTVARRQITVNIDAGGGVYGGPITSASVTPVNTLVPGDSQEEALEPFFVWQYSGTANDGTVWNDSEAPSLAGSYSVTLSLAESADGVNCNYTMTPVQDGMIIERRSVETPVLEGFFFNGTEQSVEDQAKAALQTINDLYDGLVSLDNENVYVREDAGSYQIRFVMADAATANYRWTDGAEGEAGLTVTWEIRQTTADDGLTVSNPALSGWTYGETANTPSGSVLTIGGNTIDDAVIVYVYSSKDSENAADYRLEPYTDAGVYYVRAWVAATENYAEAYSQTVRYEIAKAQYQLDDLSFSSDSVTFNGGSHSIALSGELPVGADNIAVTAVYSLGGQESAVPFALTDAGVYEITVTLQSASDNYEAPEWSRTATLTISARTVSVHWDQTQFTYNGSVQQVSAYYLDVNDARQELAVTIGDGKTFRDVGDYTATAAFAREDRNYTLSETQTQLQMLSATLIVSINAQSFPYSGAMPVLDQSAYTIVTEGDYEGLGVTLSVSDQTDEWNAGTYTISGDWDNKNYSIVFRRGTLTITPAEVAAEITLNGNLTYDGTAKTATAEIAAGLVDGESLTITLVYSGTANDGTTWNSTEAPVSAGSYTVRARISASNYVLREEGSSEAFTIARALIEKPVIDSDDTPFTVETEKTGEQQDLLIAIDLTHVGVRTPSVGTGLVPNADGSISLRATEEGVYSVSVFLRDTDNYAWSDGTTDDLTYEWTIAQHGLDPIVWTMIGLGAALGVELIILAAYFMTGSPKGGKGDPDPDQDQTSEPDPESPDDGGSEPSPADEGASESVTDESTEQVPEAENEEVSAQPSAEPVEQPENSENDGNAPQSGRTVTASFAAPALFGLLAITAGQIAGVALLAAAVAALGAVEIVLFARRSAARKQQQEPAVPQAEPVAEPLIEEEPPVEEPVAEPVPEEEPVAAEEIPEPTEEVQEEPEETVPEEPQPPEQPEEELAAAVVAAEEEEDEEEEEPEETASDENEGEDVGSIETGIAIINGRKILIRYNYSFRAKLIQSPAEVQERFGQLIDEMSAYPRVKTRESWRQVRVYSGRTTLATILFKGRKLCVAYALDPKAYEDTKYHGLDMSEVKRYAKTPMLLKIFSDRKLRYAKYLFAQVAAQNGLLQDEVVHHEFRLPYQTTEELIEQQLVKVFSNKELSEDAEYVKADIATLIREKITLKEAQIAMTDEEAAMYLEEETEQAPEEPVPVAAEPAEEGATEESSVEEKPAPKSEPVRRERFKRGIINIDTLSQNFAPHDLVTLELIKERKLIPENVDYLKVLARGFIDKPLTVEAQDFSIDAVKMILLTGGRAIRKKK